MTACSRSPNGLPIGSPIAASYRLLDPEIAADPYSRQVIRTFSFSLKFLTLVGLSEYLGRVEADPGLGGGPIDEFVTQGKLERPSLRHFAGFLRALVRDSGSWRDQSSIAGYSSIAQGRKVKKSVGGLVDDLIHVRNLVVHSDTHLREDEVPLVQLH